VGDPSSSRPRPRPLALALVTLGAVAYVALVQALRPTQMMTQLSAPGAAGWYALVLLSSAALALGILLLQVVLRRDRRSWAVGVLLAALGYAAVNVGAFALTISLDRFAIFQLAYVFSAVLVGPALAAGALIVLAATSRQISPLGLLGFALWVGSVGLAHLWVIAQASASV